MKPRKSSASLTRSYAEWVALGIRPEMAQRYVLLPWWGVAELARLRAFTPAELELLRDIADGVTTNPVLISPDTAGKLLSA
ncbi:hypothetical protein [Streptomyces sp. NPDC001221]